MATSKATSITDLLTYAASKVEPAPGREPWDYGWCVPGYRRSPEAALSTPHGPVTISGEGLTAWEEAATRLLREKKVQDRWSAEEFWGILGSMTAAASFAADSAGLVKRGVERLRTARPALTIQLVANVTWSRPPLALKDVVVGDANEAFFELVNHTAGKRTGVSREAGNSWLERQVIPRLTDKTDVRPVAFACWSTGQESLARKESERQLRNLVDLCVLFERDLAAHNVFRRGDTNRPGVRGLTLDRGAVDRALPEAAQLELSATPLLISELLANSQSVEWYGVEPLPLGDLLEQQYLRDVVGSCLKSGPVSDRIRVAARWFAEAFYTLAEDDAALALGIALDSLLAGQRALPGSAIADRFALLAQDPEQRRDLVTAYLKYYRVRSSVAHGGHSKRLDDGEFLKQYQAAVHWAAWRSIALRDAFKPSSEKGIDDLFDELRWGVRAWS